MGRLGTCCFTPKTASFKEGEAQWPAPAAAPQPPAEDEHQDIAEFGVLDLLPAESSAGAKQQPAGQDANPQGSKAHALLLPGASELDVKIAASTYCVASALLLPALGAHGSGSGIAPQAAPTAELVAPAGPTLVPSQPCSLEAAVAEVLGLGSTTNPTHAVRNYSPTPSSTYCQDALSKPCALHERELLSLEHQIAEALGDLAVTPPLLRASSSGSQWLHRSGRSSGLLTIEGEADRRFSGSGSLPPSLGTIREASSQHSTFGMQGAATAAASSESGEGHAGSGTKGGGSAATVLAVCEGCEARHELGTAGGGGFAMLDPAGTAAAPSGDSLAAPAEAAEQVPLLASVLELLDGGGAADWTSKGSPRLLLALEGSGRAPALEDILLGSPMEGDCGGPGAGPDLAEEVDRLMGRCEAAAADPVMSAAAQAEPAAAAGICQPGGGLLSSPRPALASSNGGSSSTSHGGTDEMLAVAAPDGKVLPAGTAPMDAAPSLPTRPAPAHSPSAIWSDAAGTATATAWQPLPWSECESRQEEGKLPAMYVRQLRQRQEAEKRYAMLRQQRELEDLQSCTFRPAVRRYRISAAARPTSAPSTTSSTPAAGVGCGLYSRQRAQQARTQQRCDALRRQQEERVLAECTFSPAVDPRSSRMFQDGVRYGGGSTMVTAESCSAGLDAEALSQLQALHRAGLNSLAAADLLATGRRGAEPAAPAACAAAGNAAATSAAVTAVTSLSAAQAGSSIDDPAEANDSLAAPEPRPTQPAADATLAGANTSLVASAQPSPLAGLRQSAPCAAVSRLVRHGLNSPLKASDRLYAHALDLQIRQRRAPLELQQKLQQEVLAASPKARPFPQAQHLHGPSPPLALRSLPVSRPTSATTTGWAAGQQPAPAGGRDAAYWKRFGLQPGTCLEGFLGRQERFAQALEQRLQRERQVVPAQQTGLSPGSRRILQGKREQEQERSQAGSEEDADADGDSGASDALRQRGFVRGLAGMLELAGMPPCATGHDDSSASTACEGGSEAASAVTEGGSQSARLGRSATSHGVSSAAAYQAHCTFHPTISEMAQARSPRSPEEHHAEWAARQQRLVLKREQQEAATLAACSFKPHITPAAGPASKYAKAQSRISMQHLDDYMREVEAVREAKKRASAAAVKAREEHEMAACTFQPSMPSRHQKQRSAVGGHVAQTAGTDAAAEEVAVPDLLVQVQALLGSCDSNRGSKQEGERSQGWRDGAMAEPHAPSFASYVSQVAQQLQRLRGE